MKRKNVLVATILTLTVLASSSAMAFADTKTATATATDCSDKGDIRAELNLTDAQMTLLHESKASDLKEALAKLVGAGTLTQTEADAIISNMPAEPADRGDGPFANLTETQKADRDAGPFQSLTEKQKTALESELQTLKASSLKELVSDGTITQAQADLLINHGPGNMGHPGNGDGHK
jgi:hypothetical protein